MPLPAVTTDRAPLWPTIGWGAAAALLYALTWQAALHGTDWRWFVLWFEDGAVHPQHPGYLVVAHAVDWLLAPLDLPPFDLLAVLSVGGGAVAVAGLHRAASIAQTDATDPWLPCWFAGLAMLTPALWHHATVVELHAPFFAVVAWAAVPLVRWHRARALPTVVWLGGATGLAAVMHATGQLLVPVVGVALLVSRWSGARVMESWPRTAAAFGVFGLTHGVTWGLLFGAVRWLGTLPEAVAPAAAAGAPDNPLDYLLHWFSGMDFWPQIVATVRHEWLEPYAPWSVLVLGALALRSTRAGAGALLVLVLGYLVVTVGLVHGWTDERGAYLLPLLLPALFVALRFVVSTPMRCALLLVVLLTGVTWRGEPGRQPPDHAFGRAAVALDRERPTAFFVAGFPELDGALRADPRLDIDAALRAYDELRALPGGGAWNPDAVQIAGWLQLLVQGARQRGARFVMTDRAVAWLTARVPAFAAGLRRFVDATAAARLSPAAGIAGYVVE